MFDSLNPCLLLSRPPLHKGDLRGVRAGFVLSPNTLGLVSKRRAEDGFTFLPSNSSFLVGQIKLLGEIDESPAILDALAPVFLDGFGS